MHKSIICLAVVLVAVTNARVVNLVNQCSETIWPVFYNQSLLPIDSWRLEPGRVVSVPYYRLISGRIWARSKCQFKSPCPNDLSIQHECIKCEIGDCPLGHDRYLRGEDGTRCGDVGGIPPYDIFELTTGSGDSNDFYDVSRVDGSVGNIVVKVKNYSPPPHIDPKFACGQPNCTVHAKQLCPPELQYVGTDGSYLGCASICAAVNNPQMRQRSDILRKIYEGTTTETRNPDGSIRTKGGLPLKDLVCCACGDGRGGCEVDPNSHFCCSPYVPHRPNWGGRCYNEDWPKPSRNFIESIESNPTLMQRFRDLKLDVNYASIFKVGCPDAYSWQFDDFQSTYQCRDADYTVIFCGK
jgi:hypothetical protein